MNLPPIRTLDLLIGLIGTLLYIFISIAVLRFIAPALISSQSNELVALGFMLIAIWLVATITFAFHLYTKRRSAAAITKEEDQ